MSRPNNVSIVLLSQARHSSFELLYLKPATIYCLRRIGMTPGEGGRASYIVDVAALRIATNAA